MQKLYTHREVEIAYIAKGEALSAAADQLQTEVLTNRIPNYLRALANYWFNLAALEGDLARKEVQKLADQ